MWGYWHSRASVQRSLGNFPFNILLSGHWDHENYLVITGFSLYQGKKIKKYKELGPAKLPCYKRACYYYDMHTFTLTTVQPWLSGHIRTCTHLHKRFSRICKLRSNRASLVGFVMYLLDQCYCICNLLSSYMVYMKWIYSQLCLSRICWDWLRENLTYGG